MASAITHFIVGASLALPAIKSQSIRSVLPAWAIPVSAGLAAVAPDLDTYIMRALAIPRGGIFSHRGIFHSPFFLFIACALLAAIITRRPRTTAWLTLMWAGCAITHPLLDALTDGGPGVMLLFPFTTARYFFPWRPIHVSPLSISAFFDNPGPILYSELPFNVTALVLGSGGLLARFSLAPDP